MAAPAAAGAAAKALTAVKKFGAMKAMRGGGRGRGRGGGGSNGEPGTAFKVAIVIGAIFGSMTLGMAMLAAIFGGIQEQCAGAASAADLEGVQAAGAKPFLEIYADAAAVYKVNPFLLMAVHEDESTYSSKSQGVQTGVNTAGCCAGPMQFYIGGSGTPELGGSGMTWEGYRFAYRKAKLARPTGYPNEFHKGVAVHAPGRRRPTYPYATPNVYDSYDSIYAAAMYFESLGAGPQLDRRTYDALVSYKGTPPASVPYAQADYERAQQLEREARKNSAAIKAKDEAKPKPKSKSKSKSKAAATAISLFGVAATKKAFGARPSSGGNETLLMPVAGPVTSGFGQRWGRLHAGIDIGAAAGTPIKAAASGVVNYQGPMSGYGNYFCIRHSAKLTTCYAHLSGYAKFRNGNAIARGDVLGYVGCTGHCYGDHLHFETRTGPDPSSTPADPAGYLGASVEADGSGGTAGGADLEGCTALGFSDVGVGARFAWPVDGGKVIQHSNQRGGTHSPEMSPDNWQSDNALDIGVPVGTEVYAADDGTISTTAGFGDTGQGGAFAGIRFTLEVSDNRLFYHHLSRLAQGIKRGKRVKRGQVLGWSGTANNVAHLHIGVENGKPERLFGLEGDTTAGVGKGGSIAYVGDSLGVGTEPQLRRIRPNLEIAASTMRNRTSAQGVSVLKGLVKPKHRAVIFDLGTNDGSVGQLRGSLNAARHIAGGRALLVATVNGSGSGAKNKVIKGFAETHSSTVIVIPWASSDAGLLYGDGIHATPDGYERRAKLFAEALK